MGTRISLYYIFVVFLTLFVLRPILAILFLSSEERQQILSGNPDLEISIGFWLGIESLLLPVVIAITAAFVRFIDRKPLYAIGALWPPERRRRASSDLLAAFAAAAFLLGLWYVVAGFAVRFESLPSSSAPDGALVRGIGHMVLLVLGFLASAALEEWILRGYIYSTLRERLSWVHAGGIAALLFVMLQLLTPGIPAPGILNVFLLGFVLAAIREWTGSVWPCALFHAAWNFLMGSVLSLPVSGNSVPALHIVEVTGPEPWSGGDYGPEGSWAMVILLLFAVVMSAAVLSRQDERQDEGESESDGDDGSL